MQSLNKSLPGISWPIPVLRHSANRHLTTHRSIDLDRWPSNRIVCTAGADWNVRARVQRFRNGPGGRKRRNRMAANRTFPQVNRYVVEADGTGRNRIVPEL